MDAVITLSDGRVETWLRVAGAWARQSIRAPERLRTDLTALPTLADLPNAGDQAVIADANSDLRGMIFENVAGTITYRGQLPAFRSTVFTLAQRTAVAAALLAGNTPRAAILLHSDSGGWHRQSRALLRPVVRWSKRSAKQRTIECRAPDVWLSTSVWGWQE